MPPQSMEMHVDDQDSGDLISFRSETPGGLSMKPAWLPYTDLKDPLCPLDIKAAVHAATE